jgi:hypothetical protein
MIKAKHLRIGNTVTDREGRNVFTVTAISSDRIEVEEVATIFNSVDLDPIPLTSIVLSGMPGFSDYKFPGFEGLHRHIQYGQLILRFPQNLSEEDKVQVFKLGTFEGKTIHQFLKTISHIHELQNIIFVTIGKELRFAKKDLTLFGDDE